MSRWKAADREGHRLSATQILMVRGMAVLIAALLVVVSVRALIARPEAGPTGRQYTGTAVLRELSSLRTSLDRTAGEREILELELQRTRALLAYSSRYQIPADLATLIYDTALREGIDPELAFRLVKVESGFNPRAQSSMGAIGLTQVQLSTARFYKSGVTLQDLMDPETNLTIGFRYLRDLMGTYHNLRLALLAYNRGPAKVNQLLGDGREPGNGYAATVLKGYPRTTTSP
ncbi:MAG TPA: transglycosylase SLT domain-containing protein [Gemmatimonadales bacterium]|nr:transglycosylase SLT domain-containing protein [Gemmatimonadales bacterium]